MSERARFKRIEASLIDCAAAHAIVPGLPLEKRDSARAALEDLGVLEINFAEVEAALVKIHNQSNDKNIMRIAARTVSSLREVLDA